MSNRLFKWLTGKFIKPSIIFESKPHFSDNTKAVYDEMVRRGYDKKYRLVWYLSWQEWAELKDGKWCVYNPRERKTLSQKFRNYSIYYMTKCLICCNTFLPSSGEGQITYGENQISFYLSHGTPFKKCKEIYTSPGGIDYAIAPAESIRQVMSEEFSIDIHNYYATGFPRNDVFAHDPFDLNGIFGGNYKKIIIWYPTYRQNKTVILKGNSIPIIHNEKCAEQLNETAAENDVLIVLKPHFTQNPNYLSKVNLSNIRFIDDSFFTEKGIGYICHFWVAALYNGHVLNMKSPFNKRTKHFGSLSVHFFNFS